MNTILVGQDCNGTSIQKGDTVFTDDGQSGEIKAVWDDGTVDLIVGHAHQGPVVDTFDIEGRQIVKLEE